MSAKRVAIVGAGVAGLVAALAFARQGVASDIIEQAEQLDEVGAGLQLSPNATRILDYIGVLARIETNWNAPISIDLASGRSLRTLTRIEVGTRARQKWGAPYGVLHRATLQKRLLEAVNESPLCRLHLGHRLLEATPETIANIAGERPDLIIGADGVWSRTRNALKGHGNPVFSGFVAWRFVIPEKNVPAFLSHNRVVGFLGQHTHLVSYPLRDAGGHNLVAIARGENPGEAWAIKTDNETQSAFARRNFAGWHPELQKLVASADDPTWWPLFGVSDGSWTDGRSLALVGDAAHAMLPFAAQGAAMAIEDSFTLARLVDRLPLAEALARYAADRKARVAKVRARGDFNRFAYHASGPIRLARNAVFAMTPANMLSSGLDWIYGYDAGR
ncbi:FAD-dependent monooxygenase [Rhizobium sp. L1K21]|uniref:FAD-dependent monooxygenase n=1 Tax=Rhizobium sp. L1K21 TaxID=2954933 RepID=UPI0020927038|nr:FAD-dependent monooxygenase [Rhizobium sp. L1K21]MCO6185965.1 FAD-dependent monooxygenase [Rhizobium sp. L1K21]